MANKSGVVSIGLNVDYAKSLQAMIKDFNAALQRISTDAQKVKWSDEMSRNFDAISDRIKEVETKFTGMFSELDGKKLNAENFAEYQQEMSSHLEKIRGDISNLTTQLDNLGNKNYLSGLNKQFDTLNQQVLGAYNQIKSVMDIVRTFGGADNKLVAQYEDAINKIKQFRQEAANARNESERIVGITDKDYAQAFQGDKTQLIDDIKEYKKAFDKVVNDIKLKKKEISQTSQANPFYNVLKSELAVSQAEAQKLSEILLLLDAQAGKLGVSQGIGMKRFDLASSFTTDQFSKEINDFVTDAERLKSSYQEVTTLQLKNGKLRIPVHIDDDVANSLKPKLEKIINDLRVYTESNPIFTKVQLVMDYGDTTDKKGAGKAKKLANTQDGLATGISNSIKNAHAQAISEAENIAKESVKAMQTIFDGSPIKITPNKDLFIGELSEMVNTSLGKIASDTTGLNVNNELEKLVANLREVSSSLSGNGNFKFGLDEASITRITSAIENMANMIQRAFGVASDSDINAQWSAIENKFKAVAKENGTIDGRLNKNKEAMRELAVEYKKYLDMGGSEKQLSDLTSDSNTVKKLTKYYEELGKAAEEAGQKQEQQAKKKPTSAKSSSEEKDAIKGATKENKNLETQAGKTSTALNNEGKAAQGAAEKFRKLAKEKGTAVVANRELAKAAKETADALEREAKIRKESEPRQSKNAVEGSIYNTNYLKWQRDIEKSLMDSGNYAGVYESKISQAANGTVKFTAIVRDLDGALMKFSANVNESGEISSQAMSAMSDKQAALFEKRQRDAQKVLDAIAAMDGEGSEKKFFNRAELEQGIEALLRAEESLDKFKIKKVSLEEDGKLSIAAEFVEANGQVKAFVATFNSVEDIIDMSTGAIKEFKDEATGAAKTFEQVLSTAYNSGKFTVTKDGAQSSVLARYEEIYSIAKKLGDLDVKIAGLDGTKNANQIQLLTAEYQKLEEVYIRLVGKFFKDADVGKLPAGSIEELNGVFENVEKRIDEVKAKLKDAQENLARGFGTKAQEAFDKFTLKYEGDSNWHRIAEDVDVLKQKIADIDSQDGLNKFKQNLSDIALRLKNLGKDKSLGEILGGERTFANINEVRNNIDSLFASIGKVNHNSIKIKGADKLTAEVKATNGELHKMTVSLDSNNFARYVDNGITQFGRLREAVGGIFKGLFGYFRYYLSPYMLVSYTRQVIEKVKEIDTAMTELKKVSDAPAGDIAEYFDDAVESAKKLGSTVKDMISATADWSRMGYNLPDSRELGEVAVLYKNVGDGIDIDTANESLVSTIQGFQLQAKDAMTVIDSFNEVSNNYAISSAGIGEALKRSAAAFNAANTDLNQSIALITAGNEIVQSPEKVGTMWQTVSARIRGTKTELEELGEATEDVLSTSKLQSLVKGYTGVDIMEDKDTYKDIYTIVSEIGEKWKELKDVERAALLEGLAGKKQSNTLAAVLNNAERLEEIYQTAENSMGSAQREQQRYAESLQYSLDQLSAHGEDFWYTFINKDDVKDFIDLLNGVIEKLTKVVDIFGSIPTLAGVFGGLMGIMGNGLIGTSTNPLGQTRLTGVGYTNDILNGNFFKKQSVVSARDLAALEQYNLGINALTNETRNAAEIQKIFDETLGDSSQAAKYLAKEANGAAVDINAIPKVSQAATVGLKALSVAMNVGLSLAISVLISGIYKMANAFDEMSQQAADATDKFKEHETALDDYKDKITELKTELNSENLTYAEARDKRSQLLDIQKQLIEAYGSEAKGIDLVNGSLDDQVGKLDKLNKQKRQEWENEVNKLSAGQQWQKWAGAFLNIAPTIMSGFSVNDISATKSAKEWLDNFDNTTNIERIAKKVENFKKSVSLNGLDLGTEELEALKAQLDSYEGVSFKKNKMTIAGDAKTVAETVTQIQTEVIGSRKDLQGLNQDLKDVYNAADKIVSANWATYNQALENKILNDDTGFDYYERLTKAAEAYQEAKMNGTEDAMNKTKDDYSKLLSEISDSDMNETWKKFFMDMYPDVSEVINAWKFEVEIYPRIINNENGLKDSINAIKSLTTDEISAAFSNNGIDGTVTSEQWKAITDLNAEAQSKGLNLSSFLEQLRECGFLVSDLDKRIESVINNAESRYGTGVNWTKYFRDNSIDTEEELDSWNKVTEGISNAKEAMKAYGSTAETIPLAQLNQKLLEQKEILADEYQKATDWGLGDYLSDIVDGSIQSTFGNVDMDKRTIITWSEELKKTYQDALASWEYDPEIGSIDTIFGQSSRFGEDLNGAGWEVAFTPILPDGTFLSKETVSAYIESIVSEAFQNDGSVTEDELKEIDAIGKEVGDTFVKGIFAGIDDSTNYENNGNWAETVGRLMHFSGDYGAVEIAEKNIAAIEAQIQSTEELNKALDDIQAAYSNVEAAIDEYNEQGYLSVDTFQELMKLEPEYLRYLTDEEGNLNLTTSAMNEYTSALIDSMAMKQIDKIASYVDGLTDEERQLFLTKSATDSATLSLTDYIATVMAAQVATGKLSEGELDSLKQMFNNVAAWAEQAKAGIGQGGLSTGGGKSKKDLNKEHLEKARDYAEKVADIQEDLAEKEEDFAEKMADAWKEEHLEQLKDGLEKQKDIIDRYKKNVEVIDFGLDHIETDDFSNRADLLSDKLDKLTAYGMEMRSEFDRVANTIPQTADEAVELANRLEELGSDMRDNATAVRETVTSLQMLNIEVASTLIDDRMSELQSELDNIDRRIEILNSDYKDDYGAALDVMSMDMLLPVYSEFDKKRREKQRSDKALIKVEQETQDKINEIVTKSLEMQSKENAAAREKERQELIKDMEKARKDAKKKLAEAHQDYLDFLKDNKIATTKGVQEITDAFAKADVKLPEIDITSVEEAIKKIRDKFKDFFSNGSIEFNPNINSGGGGGGLGGIGGAVIPASKNNITSHYGYRIHPIFKTNRLHRGTDFSVAEGSPIYAYSDGVVTTATYNSSYGNYVKIDHGDGRETLYAHASKLNTSVGAQVKRGQKIAESGNTGNSTGPHLHFEYIKDGKATDPKYIFPAFASGTPKGNRLSSSLGIAGENYKPEILIDKATGKATYIDEPTVIDTTTTDVVGEKATAKIPKFAEGTIGRKVTAGTGVTAEDIDALIEKYCGSNSVLKVGMGQYFIDAQNSSGIDALTLFAIASHESAYGTSQIAKVKSNLFGYGAYDADPLNMAYNYGDASNPENVKNGIVEISNLIGKWYVQNRGQDTLYAIEHDPEQKGYAYATDKEWDEKVAKHLETFANDLGIDLTANVSTTSTSSSDGTSKELEDPIQKYIDDVENLFYNKAVDEISKIEKNIIANVQNTLNDESLSDFEKSQRLADIKYNAGSKAAEEGKKIYNDLLWSYNEWIKSVEDGTADWSLEIYNAYRDAFADVSDLTYNLSNEAVEAKHNAAESRWQNSTEWIDERNKKGDWSLYADSEYEAWQRVVKWLKEKYPKELDKIKQAEQNAIDARFKNSTDWISERNEYNDWELYGDSEVEAWERVLAYLKQDYPNEIGKIKQVEKNLFDARKKEMEKSISDLDEYINARNHYDDWDDYGDSELKAVQRQTKIIEEEYKQRLISYDEYIDKLEEKTQRIYSLGQDKTNEYLSEIDDYISERNHYNDWNDFNDSEIEAINRQIKILEAAHKFNLISDKDYAKKKNEYTQKLYTVAKNDIIDTVSKLIEDYEEMRQDEREALDFEMSQKDSLKTLLQSYYDVINAVTDAQHEIDKELKASKTMYEYLNEETRKLLFNQEDYNILNEELLEIQDRANKLQERYEEKILNASKEDIAEITSQYQMQYETMMKQYEIAKAELDVAKKRQKLDNVLSERNVRMFVNGQWQWVAKTQDIIDAQNELAEAEYEKSKQESSLEQTNSINKITAAQDDLTTQINYLETDLEQIRDKWSEMQELLNGNSDEVAEALREISGVTSPELKRVIELTTGDVGLFAGSISGSMVTISESMGAYLNAVSIGVDTIVADLESYSKAMQELIAKMTGTSVNNDSGKSSAINNIQDTIAQMQANSEKWFTASEEEQKELHRLNDELSKSIDANYDSKTGKWYSSDGKLLYSVSSSSGGSSSSSKGSSGNDSSSSKSVNTSDQYVKDSSGYIQSNPNWDGKKSGGVGSYYKHADGTRYTPGGFTALGEEGFEAYITDKGRLIPITQPTIGNIGAGGVVFNREQLASLRSLWDLSNLGKISPFISSSNANSQSTIIDNSIHINGLTVGEQGNEDWINGLRRYVATHK